MKLQLSVDKDPTAAAKLNRGDSKSVSFPIDLITRKVCECVIGLVAVVIEEYFMHRQVRLCVIIVLNNKKDGRCIPNRTSCKTKLIIKYYTFCEINVPLTRNTKNRRIVSSVLLILHYFVYF